MPLPFVVEAIWPMTCSTSSFSRYRHAQGVPEVVADPALAPVPHLGEIRHLLRVPLLHVRRVDYDQRVVVDAWRGIAQNASVHLRVHPLRRQMPFKPFLRLLGQDVLLERTRDLAHQRVARGLYAEEHLPQKLHLPAAVVELGRKYPQVFSELFSRFERNYAIISHVGSSLVVFGKWHYTTSSKWNRLFAYFTSRNSSRPIKSGMRLVSGVKNWGYSSAVQLSALMTVPSSVGVRFRRRMGRSLVTHYRKITSQGRLRRTPRGRGRLLRRIRRGTSAARSR